jgi:hypothetical protein
MKVSSKDEFEVIKIIKSYDEVKKTISKPNEKRSPVQVKPICLLMGYMYNLL